MAEPLVELDGDEMTRVIWQWVKEILIEPHVELKTVYFDLGLPERERTKDQVTRDAAAAIKRHGVGVKCATITPNAERVKEYQLTEAYLSPNATIRAELGGTVFRTPIICRGITPFIPNWLRPITIARHAYGDIYKGAELRCAQELAGAKVELVATGPDGCEQRVLIRDFGEGATESAEAGTAAGIIAGTAEGATGIVQGIFNTDSSIEAFARTCMTYALETRQDLWFGAKDTISKTYDRRFRDIFDEQFRAHFKERFDELGIEYFYSLIDDVVARVIRSEGGFIWACRNYDGDVMSDMVATAYGSLAMMTSVLVSPQGCYEYEAAHGTVQRHYYQHLQGLSTSTNPVATLFAWTGALKKRGELDGIDGLCAFASRLEAAAINTIESGTMTGDLYVLSDLAQIRKVSTRDFLNEVARNLGAN